MARHYMTAPYRLNYSTFILFNEFLGRDFILFKNRKFTSMRRDMILEGSIAVLISLEYLQSFEIGSRSKGTKALTAWFKDMIHARPGPSVL